MAKLLTKSHTDSHDPNNRPRTNVVVFEQFERARNAGFVGEIINLGTGERKTTRDILEKSERYAKGLLALGLVPGTDNVVGLGCCSLEAVCIYAAALTIGVGYAHPDIQSPRENSIVIQTSLVSPKVVVCGEGAEGLTLSALLNLFDGNAETSSSSKLPSVEHLFYDDTYKSRSPSQRFLQRLDKLIELGQSVTDEELTEAKRSVRPNFVARHVFSSGSTGQPKCVSHTHLALCVDDLSMMPCSIITTNVNTDSMTCFTIMMSSLCGYTKKAVLIPEVYAEQSLTDVGKIIAQSVIDEQIECTMLMPGQLRMLITYLLSSKVRLPSVKVVLYAGMMLTQRIKEDCEKCLDAILIAAYGMSECIGVAAERPGVGKQSTVALLEPVFYLKPNSELRIVDANDEVVDIGENGEIQIKTYSALKEYRGDPQKTREVFTDDGFIRSGDMGMMKPDGGFIVKGRATDCIRFKIFNKVEYPGPIEQIIAQHPDVLEAAVFAGGHNEWMGDEITCCIVMKSGSQELNSSELLQFYETNGMNNDRQKPARMIYFDAFPYTANGRKVNKKELMRLVQRIIEEDEDIGKCQWFIDLERAAKNQKV